MSVHTQFVPAARVRAPFLARPLALLQQYKGTYIALNVFYYSIILVGMVYAVMNPALQQSVLQSAGMVFSQGAFSAVGDAYLNGQILPAVALTFGINLLIGSFGTITLPSLVIPFSGLLMGAYRAFLWGLIYSPTSPELQTILLPHSITLLLEGQAYVLALLGAVIQGRAFLFPQSVGVSCHRRGLWLGIKRSAQLYVLVTLTLAVAAVYEVLEAVLLLSVLQP